MNCRSPKLTVNLRPIRRSGLHGTLLNFALTFLMSKGPCIVSYVSIIIQKDATIYSSFISVNCWTCFDVLLNVHLSIFILVINQRDSQNVCFTIILFHASTCFKHYVLIIRRSTFYYAASGVITPKIGVMTPEAV